MDDYLARGRRKRCNILLQTQEGCSQPSHRLQVPSTAIRRTIIRHLILVLDLSASMLDRDMRPTRFSLTLQYAREFVLEWFDQNPLGQMGVVGMRAGVGERVVDMTGVFVLCSQPAPVHTEIQAIHRMSSKPSPTAIDWSRPVNQACRMRLNWQETV